MKLAELVLDVLFSAAAHLAADPLAAGPVPKRHRPAPAPGTALMVTSIPAVAGVIEVDRIVAKVTSTHAGSVTLGSHIGSQLDFGGDPYGPLTWWS